MRSLARFVGRSLLASALVAASSTAAAFQDPQDEKRVNPNAKAIAEFQEEVQEYIELHRKLERTLPDLPKDATPLQIDQRQRALGALIQDARRGQGVGDIFERDVRPVIRRLLYGMFSGPEGKRLRLSVNEENPGEVVKLTVNGRYPDTIPVSTVPPQVLALLPPLPPELEYRFIGSTLILLDAHAHIIVDYLTGAVPR
jgi:hypothetical protein